MLPTRPRLQPSFGVVPRHNQPGGQEIRPSFIGDTMKRRVGFILLDGLDDRIRGLTGTSRGGGFAGFQVGFDADCGRGQS